MQFRSHRAEQYRRRADRLRGEADGAQTPEARAELLSLARKYEALAAQVERISDHFAAVLTRLGHE